VVGLIRRAGLCLGLCLVLMVSAYTVAVHPAYGQSVVRSLHPKVESAMSPDPYPRVVGKGWVPFSRLPTIKATVYAAGSSAAGDDSSLRSQA
jgi:hypothetical protein